MSKCLCLENPFKYDAIANFKITNVYLKES